MGAFACTGKCQLVNIVPKIDHVVRAPPIATNEEHERSFERKHLPAKPIVQGIIVDHMPG
jgi:hypothetical protein